MGLPSKGIIDVHVHLYPDEVNADPIGWAGKAGEPLWAAMVEDRPDRKVRQGWSSVDQLLRDMDAAAVAHAILLGWYWEKQETCAWHNRFYADCVRQHPDRLSAFATTQASSGAAALEEMKRSRDDGLIGLGEMCPWSFGAKPTDSEWMQVFHLAVDMSWPVNLHVTDPDGRRYPGRVETPLEDVMALAEALPDLRLILAHLGGGLAFGRGGERARNASRNIFYDTAALPLMYRRAAYNCAMDASGPGRVFFGTDYPLMVFPKTQNKPCLERSVAHAHESVESEDRLDDLLGQGARSFFGA